MCVIGLGCGSTMFSEEGRCCAEKNSKDHVIKIINLLLRSIVYRFLGTWHQANIFATSAIQVKYENTNSLLYHMDFRQDQLKKVRLEQNLHENNFRLIDAATICQLKYSYVSVYTISEGNLINFCCFTVLDRWYMISPTCSRFSPFSFIFLCFFFLLRYGSIS